MEIRKFLVGWRVTLAEKKALKAEAVARGGVSIQQLCQDQHQRWLDGLVKRHQTIETGQDQEPAAA